MRQVLLAILLVGAAFAGGAAVNGPGLRWVRDNVLKKMADDGEAPTPEVSGNGDHGMPSAPVPTVVNDSPPQENPKTDDNDQVAPKKDPTPAPRSRLKAETPAPKTEPKTRATLALPGAPESLATVPPLEAPDDAEAPRKTGDKTGQTPSWADMPDSAPAAAVVPKPYRKEGDHDSDVASAAMPAIKSSPSSIADWTELRRKMSALGVARYGFEGEPSGRVRFHCVIPLAGRRAVGQQFEAEGDNEFEAARTALRRVALWRATEPPPAQP